MHDDVNHSLRGPYTVVKGELDLHKHCTFITNLTLCILPLIDIWCPVRVPTFYLLFISKYDTYFIMHSETFKYAQKLHVKYEINNVIVL